MILILGDSLLAIKLYLIMTSLLITPTLEKLQNPKQFPLVLRSLLFFAGVFPGPFPARPEGSLTRSQALSVNNMCVYFNFTYEEGEINED